MLASAGHGDDVHRKGAAMQQPMLDAKLYSWGWPVREPCKGSRGPRTMPDAFFSFTHSRRGWQLPGLALEVPNHCIFHPGPLEHCAPPLHLGLTARVRERKGQHGRVRNESWLVESMRPSLMLADLLYIRYAHMRAYSRGPRAEVVGLGTQGGHVHEQVHGKRAGLSARGPQH